MKAKLYKEQIELLEWFGHAVDIPEEGTYYYLPFWFKQVDDNNLFEVYHLNSLPDELKEAIKEMGIGDNNKTI